MMPISLTMLEDDFKFIRADLPQTITIGEVTQSAVVHDLAKAGESLLDAGVESEYTLEAVILKSEWNPIPDAPDKATYNGKQYRVLHWQDSPDGLNRTLYMEDLTK